MVMIGVSGWWKNAVDITELRGELSSTPRRNFKPDEAKKELWGQEFAGIPLSKGHPGQTR